MDAAKQVKQNTDPKDETVRGSLPLFKLRSKQDREQWRKLAFPTKSMLLYQAGCANEVEFNIPYV